MQPRTSQSQTLACKREERGERREERGERREERGERREERREKREERREREREREERGRERGAGPGRGKRKSASHVLQRPAFLDRAMSCRLTKGREEKTRADPKRRKKREGREEKKEERPNPETAAPESQKPRGVLSLKAAEQGAHAKKLSPRKRAKTMTELVPKNPLNTPP